MLTKKRLWHMWEMEIKYGGHNFREAFGNMLEQKFLPGLIEGLQKQHEEALIIKIVGYDPRKLLKA